MISKTEKSIFFIELHKKVNFTFFKQQQKWFIYSLDDSIFLKFFKKYISFIQMKIVFFFHLTKRSMVISKRF